jgi:hypothetical protein
MKLQLFFLNPFNLHGLNIVILSKQRLKKFLDRLEDAIFLFARQRTENSFFDDIFLLLNSISTIIPNIRSECTT